MTRKKTDYSSLSSVLDKLCWLASQPLAHHPPFQIGGGQGLESAFP